MTQAVTLAGLGSTTPTIVSPTLTSPVLGTPVSGSLVNCTDVNYTGFKNRIINGGMVIDQRNAGASVTPVAGQYTLDRFNLIASQSSKFTVQQNAGAITPPVGFSNYLGCTSLSAYSVLVGDFFGISQKIEGFNVADLGWGTANAQTVTLSFWVRSSLTGTFGGGLRNASSTRGYPFTYSIPVANTWTTISVTIAGDTTGTWLTNNDIGISVTFGLGVGSTYSGTAGSWSGANYVSATGAVSVVGTSGATFYITGVQLEKGSVATSFDYRPYGTELSLCQRYYEVLINTASTAPFIGTYYNATVYSASWFFKQSKRVTPTIALGPTAAWMTSTPSINPSIDILYLQAATIFYPSSVAGTIALSASAEL